MSSLRDALADYLAVRRAVGYKLDTAERFLSQFIEYLEERGEQRVTIDHAVAWAIRPSGHPGYHASAGSLATCTPLTRTWRFRRPAC